MFLGHYAVALASKKVAPRASLGTTVLAAQFIDLLWPVFLLVGLESVRIRPGITVVTPLDFYHYPITHSLVGAAGWAVMLGVVYYAVRRYRRGAVIVAAAVLSHWFLDAIVHRPDLPLFPTGTIYVGFGLWNSLAGTMAVELGLFVAGLALYLASTAALDRIGRYVFWSLAALVVGLWLAAILGPPPPSERAVTITGLGQWPLVAWAYWADRHRKVVGEAVPGT